MKKEMLINVSQPEECRIAIVEDGILEELYVERSSSESIVGNIYKGKIVNIEGSIQAAFVDFGTGRNGFLHVSDVDPAYYRHLLPKDVLERLDAEDRDGPPRGGYNGGSSNDRGGDRGDRGGRNRDRGDRGERSDRGDRGDRSERVDRGSSRREDPVTEPKVATSWLAPAESTTTSTSDEAELHDIDGFGEGIEDGAGFVEVFEEVTLEETTIDLVAAPPAPMPKPKPPRVVKPAEPDIESGFGSGLLDDFAEFIPASSADSSGPIAVAMDEMADAAESMDAVETVEIAEPADAAESTEPNGTDEEKPKTRGRGRPKKKAEEGEVKKPTRRRKKADDSGESDDAIPVPSAEHRTSPPDEPEIKSFFDDGFGSGFDANFDPNAPNDRFVEETKPEAAPASTDELPTEGTMLADEEFVDETSTELTDEEFDAQFAPKPMREDDDRRDRRGGGRDGGRGGRSGSSRGGPRDRNGGPPRERRPGGSGGGGGNSRLNDRDRGLPRMPIEKIFKRGQEVIVQVIKDGIGTKGPTLSTFISIAGRYLVLMPHLSRIGVSRKIEDVSARRRLREIMNELEPPKGVGFIVRTAAIDRNTEELQGDLIYLLKLWQVVVKRIKKMPAPVEIYRESDIITRTIRDNFKADIDKIYVDEPMAYQQASEFMQIVMPRYADRIALYEGTEPLFHRYRVEEEIAKINQKRIDLPRGGSIIIEQTEALVAIDVNSGNFRADNNAEETAFQMNLIAAREIARQLRLRDLGGVIVNDFIDMRNESHRRQVEDALTQALARDKARTKILRISQFGIIEMTRQRMQPSLKKRIFNECPHCKATGHVKNAESMGIDVMRTLQLAAHKAPPVTSVQLTINSEVAQYLLNKKRRDLAALEEKAQIEITIQGVVGVGPEHLEMKCFDGNGTEVRLSSGPPMKMGGGEPPRDRDDRGGNRGRRR